ncbi:pyrroline-5-carboxylate reductase [Orbaceae bacterium ESL0727]|nr:pyrroline-5-carboxylate reductase [Orbaceae bacterium ESL0727]
MHKILFIGGGQMSEAIIRALINHNVYAPTDIGVNDIAPARIDYLHSTYNIQDTCDLNGVEADLIVLAVRPQDAWHTILTQLQPLNSQAVLISIIAGVTIAQLKQALTVNLPVVRTIPNTLTDTGFGYSGVATDEQDSYCVKQQNVLTFLTGFGKIEPIDESLLDIFTGYSVAGPNYIYYFYESLVDAGVLAGLPRDKAKRLAIENLHGAASMLTISQKHPRELLDINNSPAGVGMHALYELNNSDFAAGLQRSVLAAVKRTVALGIKTH